MRKCGAARPTQKLARRGSGVRSGSYFGGETTNKFNTKYHTIQKEYLRHYSKFHEVMIIYYELEGIAKLKIANTNYIKLVQVIVLLLIGPL